MKTPLSPTVLRSACACLSLAAISLAHAADSQPTIEKCPREMGTLAVAEPQDQVLASLRGYGLGSPSVMLRMMVQESGCFAVVERGVAMQNLQQERALANSGQLQEGSNIGAGQMQGADFVMTPVVQFSGDSGGVGGAVGGLFSRAGGLLGSIGGLAGGVKFKEAETTLLLADVRSSIQVASAEGKASKMDFSLGGWGWGGLGWAAGGGYSKTPEGKLLAASLLDNYNKIVLSIRDRSTLIRNNSVAAQNNAAQATRATNSSPPPPPPAQVAVAPTTVVVPGGAYPYVGGVQLPAGMFGAFNGQFAGGSEQGTFSLVIGPMGQVTGIGQSSSSGNFQVAGMVTPNGMIVMGSANQGGNLKTQFNGFINPSTGELIGTWRLANGSAQGTFNGKRQ